MPGLIPPIRVKVGSWTDCDMVIASPTMSSTIVSLFFKSCAFKLKSLKFF